MEDIKIIYKKEMKTVLDYFLVLFEMMKYYTMWNIITVILYFSGYFQDSLYTILLFQIAIIICTIYIFYIKKRPMLFNTKYIEIKITGKTLLFLDFIFHYIPLILIISKFKKLNPSRKKNYYILSLPFIYLLLFDTKRIYGIKPYFPLLIYIIIILLK
tara:strand:+ start:104 stop:577 length:474 start_codon:yes stop_codon:yes gene_type:complete